MKKLLTSLLFLMLAFAAYGAGPTISTTNGTGSQISFHGTNLIEKATNLAGSPYETAADFTGSVAFKSTNLVAFVPSFVTSGGFVGFGSRSNLLIDTGVSSSSFDVSGASTTAMTALSNSITASNAIATASRVLYIGTNGNDGNLGTTTTSPLKTLGQAFVLNHSNGVVIVMGPNYTNLTFSGNGVRGKIQGYNLCRPTNILGYVMGSNSFVSTGANGFFTNTPTPTFISSFISITNTLGYVVPIFQLNTPYGTQGTNQFYMPPMLMGDDGLSNRCFNYPLLPSICGLAGLNNSNGFFLYTNGVLWVKPAISNVMGDIMVSSSNSANCFITGIDSGTDLEIEGIFVEGGFMNFNISGPGRVKITDSLSYGGYLSGIGATGTPIRHEELLNDEIVAGYFNDVDVQGGVNTYPSMFKMEHCLIHDDFEVGLHVSGGARGDATRSMYFGGTNLNNVGQGGYISDGGTLELIDDLGFSHGNYVAQMGASSPFGRLSFVEMINGYYNSYGTGPGIEMDDSRGVLNIYGALFDVLVGAPVNVNGGFIGTQNAHTFGAASVNNLQTSTMIAAGAHVPSFGDPQFSSAELAYGNDVPVVADYFYGRDASAGLISDNFGRFTAGIKVGGGPTPTVIDINANVFPNNLNTTNLATFNQAVFTNGFTVNTTNVAPGNTTTPKLWITITNAGVAYRVPLYQ